MNLSSLKIVAIESSGRDGSIAALLSASQTETASQTASQNKQPHENAAALLAIHELSPEARTAESLVPALQKLVLEQGWTPAELDLVGVVVGPGSFTGLRIGITVAKSIAYACGATLIGLDTLDVLARQAAEELLSHRIVFEKRVKGESHAVSPKSEDVSTSGGASEVRISTAETAAGLAAETTEQIGQTKAIGQVEQTGQAGPLCLGPIHGGVAPAGPATQIWAISDAQRRELFVTRYSLHTVPGSHAILVCAPVTGGSKEGAEQTSAAQILPIETFLANLGAGDMVVGPVIIPVEGKSTLRDRLPPHVLVASPEVCKPHAATVGRMAFEKLLANDAAAEPKDLSVNVWQLSPVYLRLSAAEEKLQEKLNKSQEEASK